MRGPRDNAPRYPRTDSQGVLLTDHQLARLEALRAARAAFSEAMHMGEGSAPPGEHQEHVFTTRRMNIAKTHLETALLFAEAEVMSSP